MTGPNGAGGRFDKLMRSEMLRKEDDVLKTLRKLAPGIAQKVEALEATFSALLAKLEAIEATHEEHRRAARTLVPAREPNGDDILASMRTMTPDARATLLNKLKQ
jgi:hypothetical protein